MVKELEVQKDNLNREKVRLANDLMESKQMLIIEQNSNIEKGTEIDAL